MVSEEQINKLLRVSSFHGLQAIYMCFLAEQGKVAFVLSEIDSAASEDYLSGYLVALHSLNVLTTKIHRGRYTIDYIHEGVKEKITEAIKQRAKNVDEEHNIEPDDKFSWVRQVQVIEDYFK